MPGHARILPAGVRGSRAYNLPAMGWFSGKAIDEFADSIVAELMERFPPTGIELSTEKSASVR